MAEPPWSLFDGDGDDTAAPAPAAPLPAAAAAAAAPADASDAALALHVAAVLADFVSRHASGATEDLCSTGGEALARHLGALCTAALRLHALLRRGGGAPDAAAAAARAGAWAQVGAASRAAADLAWAQLRSPAAWPHVCWREAYCMAQVGLSAHLACGGGGGSGGSGGGGGAAQGAMAALDTALIMGAPRAEVEGLVALVEAAAVAAAAAAAEAGAPLPSLPAAATVLPAGLPTSTPGQWVPRRRVAAGAGAPPADPAAPPLPAAAEHPTLAALRSSSSSAAAAAAAAAAPAAPLPPLAPADFASQHVAGAQPVVLQGLLAHWPALQRWRHLDYWAAALGHRTVPIERGVAAPPGAAPPQPPPPAPAAAAPWREELRLFSDFLREDMAGGLPGSASSASASSASSERVAYLAQHALFEQCPEFREKGDFDIPAYLTRGVGVGAGEVVCNVWMGTAGTVTHAHFDSYENVLGQVAGYKFVRLFPPGAAGRLQGGAGAGGGAVAATARSSAAAQGNTSALDVCAPGFDASGCWDAVLGPGDALFIPVGWWHYVRSVTPSISLNFWWLPQH